jgi:hypothetical protein
MLMGLKSRAAAADTAAVAIPARILTLVLAASLLGSGALTLLLVAAR